MEIQTIKPGSKPLKDDGTPDNSRRVAPSMIDLNLTALLLQFVHYTNTSAY